ncbi:hypothetical protein CJF42_17925 [Pseudoalteromonas sp. NBT06-2]|uniref:Na+/H+ antiporter subunit E n=1 Tax=Pseudoalteromonas sp. NBT06-2 TaxID=2025950 RepID=UPI000BA62471|nr:Na+/H+ antiporter subunit E [Pseudoalteromonas sp. NBT06-2]PAJ73043.1 hypothetical protein CJF42_17925 [Pseudoalteromonas sp. NBT06-2]
MRLTLSLFLLLIIFWTVNSGHYTHSILILGLLSIVLVLLICQRMKLVDQESLPLHLLIRISAFYCWLTKEIILGGIYVLKRILQGDTSIDPKIINIPLDFKDDICKVIFANSITLTPGTITLKLDNESIQVHALTTELADALINGEMARRIKMLES